MAMPLEMPAPAGICVLAIDAGTSTTLCRLGGAGDWRARLLTAELESGRVRASPFMTVVEKLELAPFRA